MIRTKNATKRRHAKSQLPKPDKQPFLEHVYELRRRLFYIIVSVTIFSCAAYGIEHSIVDALLKPAKHQEFIYTTPGGGLDFLFRLCLYVGLACSIPVIVYQLLRYLEPLLRLNTRRAVVTGSIASGVLAAIGMTFGYFVGLPAAMHFLMHQFITPQIQPLLTIQSYMSFVLVYMLGSALLLQVPLILLIINRIKPLKPQKLLSLQYERWVIVIGFVGGALMNPNPNLMAQLIVIVPIIIAYQVGVLLVWLTNRRKQTPKRVTKLLEQDAEAQEVRRQAAARARSIEPVFAHIPVRPAPLAASPVAQRPTVSIKPAVAIKVAKATTNKPNTQHVASHRKHPTAQSVAQAPRQRRYINDFAPRRAVYRPAPGLTSENANA